jgi:hypothetical protein
MAESLSAITWARACTLPGSLVSSGIKDPDGLIFGACVAGDGRIAVY